MRDVVVCAERVFFTWLISVADWGTPLLDRPDMEAHLADRGVASEDIKTMLDRAWLHGSSDPKCAIDDVVRVRSERHGDAADAAALLAAIAAQSPQSSGARRLRG